MDKNKNKIMNFKKFFSYFRESAKDDEVNRILDKISKNEIITKNEKDFLDKFDQTRDEDVMNFKLLTADSMSKKIQDLLDNKTKIICNLTDRNGKIGSEIDSISVDYKYGVYKLHLKNGFTSELKDNFLYNMIYDGQKGEYSLEPQDEYYERIPVKNEDNK